MHLRKILVIFPVLLLFLCIETFPARADIVILQDGRAIEGEILKQNRDEVTIKTKAGITVTVERDEVERIVTKDDLKKEYRKKLAAIKDKDDEYARLELAEWCKENGLKDEYRAELEHVLRVNPENTDARRELDLLDGKLPENENEDDETRPASGAGKPSAKKVSPKPRRPRARRGLLGSKGNPEKSDESKRKLKKALAFLAAGQAKSGQWPIKMSHINGQVVVASICGLAFIADGSTPTKGPYKVQVGRALTFVRKAITAQGAFSSPSSGKEGNWNQSNWRWSFGGMFLAECYACHKDPATKARLQQVVRLLEGSQEESGGWGHGPGGPNALGYVELEVMSNYALATLGMAKQLGCKVNAEKLEKAIKYVVKCVTKEGGVAYSTRPNQIRTGCPGRTGGALLAFSACGYDEPVCQKMSDYLEEKMEEIPEGHASPALHFLGSGLGSLCAHEDVWDIFTEKLYPKIFEKMQPDGSFLHITNKEGDKDEKNGRYYTSGVFTLMLAADMGKLNFCGGVFGKKGTGISVKSTKQRREEAEKARQEAEKARKEAEKAREEANRPAQPGPEKQDPGKPAENPPSSEEEDKVKNSR